MDILAVELSSGEIATAITATLTAVGTVTVSIWKYVISPAIKTLRESISAIEASYENKLEIVRDEVKSLKTEYETKIREMRSGYEQSIKEMREDHDEKMTALETRHTLQLEKMDTALANCHKERETAILWKARYEQRIHELEKVALEGKITAVPDSTGALIITTSNIAVSKMFGYTRAELIGMPVENLISNNFRSRHKEKVATHSSEIFTKFNRVINGGIALHKDGSKFPVTVEIDSTLVNGTPGWSGVITLE